MSETPILKLQELDAAQAQPEVKVNAAWRALEVVVQLRVLERVASLPGTPVDGDRYILTAATGGGEEHDVAYYSGGWHFFAPETGWKAYVVDDAADFIFLESGWAEYSAGGGGGDGGYVPLIISTPMDAGASVSFDTTGFDDTITDVFLLPHATGSSFQSLNVAATDGHRFRLWNNQTAGTLTIQHNSSSNPIYGFICPNVEDYAIPPGGGVLIQYDTDQARWRVLAASGAGGGGGGGAATFRGVMVSSSSYLTWTSDDVLGWDVEVHDTDNFFDQFGVNQFQFTIPGGGSLAGFYYVFFDLPMTNQGDGTYRRVVVRKNGSTELIKTEVDENARSIQGGGIISLADGDYVELEVEHDAAGTVQTDPVHIGSLPRFGMHFLGG